MRECNREPSGDAGDDFDGARPPRNRRLIRLPRALRAHRTGKSAPRAGETVKVIILFPVETAGVARTGTSDVSDFNLFLKQWG